jgi:hypothetical protein
MSVECGYGCVTSDAYALVARQLMANANMYDTQDLECSNSRMLVPVLDPNYRQKSELRVEARTESK